MRFSLPLVVVVTLGADVAAASVPCGLGAAPEPAAHGSHHAAVESPGAPDSHGHHAAAGPGAHAEHPAAQAPEPAEAAAALKPACRCGCGKGTPLARAGGKRLGPSLPSGELDLLSFERPPAPAQGTPALVSAAGALPEPVPIAR